MAERLEVRHRTTTFGLGMVNFDAVHENRGWFLGVGLALMVLGVLAVLMPVVASLVTAFAIGALLALSGLLQGIHAVRTRRWASSAWSLLSALAQIMAGVLIMAFPTTGKVTLTLILAAFFFVDGLLRIVRAVQHREMPAWGFLLFDGLVTLALGVLILWKWPSTGAWAIGLLVGVDLMIGGSSMLLIGLSARPRAEMSSRA